MILATGVTPGSPGQFTPGAPTHRPPITQAELDTINGGAPWTTYDDYVDVNGIEWYWDGSAWQMGRVPSALATGATPGAPGAFTPAPPAFHPPTTPLELTSIHGGAPWTTVGDYISVGGTFYHWDGAQWEGGRVPAALVTSATARHPRSIHAAHGRPPQDKSELDTDHFWCAWLNPGDYIDTGDGNQWHWDGSAWQTGPVPAPIPPTSITPIPGGGANVVGGSMPNSLADLNALGALGNPPFRWPGDTWIQLGDGTYAHWNGNQWARNVSDGTVSIAAPNGPGAAMVMPANTASNPMSVAELQAWTAMGVGSPIVQPTTAWTYNQFVSLQDGGHALLGRHRLAGR